MHISNVEAAARLARQRDELRIYRDHFTVPVREAKRPSAEVSDLTFYFIGRSGESHHRLASNVGLKASDISIAVVEMIAAMVGARLDEVERQLQELGVSFEVAA